jgi:hypothetical protein
MCDTIRMMHRLRDHRVTKTLLFVFKKNELLQFSHYQHQFTRASESKSSASNYCIWQPCPNELNFREFSASVRHRLILFSRFSSSPHPDLVLRSGLQEINLSWKKAIIMFCLWTKLVI